MTSPPSLVVPRPDEMSQFRSLARKISRGECVLVLGPGAATAPDQTHEVPLSVELSKLLAEDKRVERVEGLNRCDLRHVSQVLYEATRSLSGLQDSVAQFYERYKGQTTPFHRNVAALPFKFCLTTTPDDFLFNALSEKDTGKTPSRHFYNFRKAQPEPGGEPTVERPLVYHLYGYPDEPDSLVITETDLIDFVTKVILNEPPLAKNVRAELAKPTTTCLFIDLGFKNWYLRALLRVLNLYGHQDTSVAVEDAEFFQQSGLHQTTLYFAASQAIEFRQESLDEFATQLRQAHELLAAAKGKAAPVPLPGAPQVFLSYVHEDREAVDRLTDSLLAAGIKVWQDHQNLRVGDRWGQALGQVINKQADYVAVVQTPALAQRVETYVGVEVDEALIRHRRMLLGGFRFLLPLRLGVTSNLPLLEELHGIDVATEGGCRSLVGAILEDWKRRAEQQA